MVFFSNIFALLRPKQWRKNAFVFLGYLFGPSWMDKTNLLHVFLAIIAFCLVSSAIYILNDYKDQEKDRNHPTKRQRPLAAGTVTLTSAFILMALLFAGSLLIALYLSPLACLVVVLYVCINIAYTFGLKSVVILDVFCISAGFILRILMGIIVVGAYPSDWFLLCGMGLTLFLAFSKRYAELVNASDFVETRQVLQSYTLPFLQNMMLLCAASTIMFYSLYTICPRTTALHHTENLIMTVPLVVYGFMRYIYIVYTCHQGEDPSSVVTKDKHILFTVLFWIIATAVIIR